MLDVVPEVPETILLQSFFLFNVLIGLFQIFYLPVLYALFAIT